MPLSEGNFPANRWSQTMQLASLSPCRAAAQFNPAGAVDAPIARLFAFDYQGRRATEQHRSATDWNSKMKDYEIVDTNAENISSSSSKGSDY